MKHILFACLFVFIAALPARAQDAFAAALPGLLGGFNDIATAADRLGASADPRALPLLRALADGRLLKREATLLIRADGAVTDASTGAAADAAGAEAIRLNNRVRVDLRGAIGRLALVSPDAAERAAAAEAVFRSRSADNIPILEAALARESVPRIRAQMELSLAASRLIAPDPAIQRQGIAALAAAGTGITTAAAAR